MSVPELLLWAELRKRPAGYKFRRQSPQDAFSVDFACLGARLGIEVDGNAHDFIDRAKSDATRDIRLNDRGLRVLRIPASEILNDLSAVIEAIVAECPKSGPPPSRRREK